MTHAKILDFGKKCIQTAEEVHEFLKKFKYITYLWKSFQIQSTIVQIFTVEIELLFGVISEIIFGSSERTFDFNFSGLCLFLHHLKKWKNQTKKIVQLNESISHFLF